MHDKIGSLLSIVSKENSLFTIIVNSLQRNALKITDCIDDWDGHLFNYTLYWTIPQFWAYGNGIFTRFVLSADQINSGLRTKRFIRSEDINKIENKTTYKYTWINFNPLDDLYSYEFKV